MNSTNLSEEELFNKFEKWICDNVKDVQKAQDAAKKISELYLINPKRNLPFEMVPVDDNFDMYDLIVYLDHPRYGTTNLHIKDNKIYFFDQEDNPDSKINMNQSEFDEYLELQNNSDVVVYKEFLDFIEKRNYTEINKIINSELSKYRLNIDNRLKEIKKYLSSIENIGLTNRLIIKLSIF